MFFERYHDREKVTVFPGLQNHVSRFKENPEDSSRFRLELPSEEELKPKKAELLKKVSLSSPM